jgi:hypothetical protein
MKHSTLTYGDLTEVADWLSRTQTEQITPSHIVGVLVNLCTRVKHLEDRESVRFMTTSLTGTKV